MEYLRMALAEENTYSAQALPLGLHAVEQFHGALFIKQEIFVHDEERMHVHGGFHLAHDLEQFFAGLVEIQELALAAEECRRGAEVAAHGAAYRRNDGGGRLPGGLGHAQSHGAETVAGNDVRVLDGGVRRPRPDSARIQEMPSPLQCGRRRSFFRFPEWPPRGRPPRWWIWATSCAHHAAHLADLADVHDDRRDADDVVGVFGQLAREGLARGEIEHRAGRRRYSPGSS